MSFRPAALLACLSSLSVVTLLSGCSMNELAPATTQSNVTMQGSVHGGQQPISGAHVYMLQAATNGYGQPSVSVLQPTFTGTSDSVGAYVLTTSTGSFTIYGDYTCTTNTQVYLYALGGNPGAGTNSAAGLLAALGNCPTSGSFGGTVPFISMNEVSTIAAAYSLAGYAVDATHVGSSGSTLANTYVGNAFLTPTSLVSVATGVAYTTTPAGNGVVPQTTINTLANIISACINSTGPSSSACTTLFANARASGSTGTIPTDTATAAINIAHNPASNVTALFNLATANPPFSPSLAAVPNDFMIGITYAGQGSAAVAGAYSIAIDAAGNAWFTNVNNNSISKLSSTGTPLSPASGYTAGNQFIPTGIAIDLNGNAWVSDSGTNNLTEYGSNGVLVGQYTGGGLSSPQGLAIDGTGNVFTVNFGNNSLSKFSSAGVAISPATTGYTGGGINKPTSIAIDSSGFVWSANQAPSPGTLSKFTNSGVSTSSSAGLGGGGLNNPIGIAFDNAGDAFAVNYAGNSLSEFNTNGVVATGASGFSGGGLNKPYQIAIDGAGNLWACNYGGSTISEFTNVGVAVSPSTGFGKNLVSGPQSIDIDGSGNVWVASNSTSSTIAVTEFIGAAVPRVTPLSIAIQKNQVGVRP